MLFPICWLTCKWLCFKTKINVYAYLQAHVEYETAKRHYAHVDCPGHADYVKVSVLFPFFLGVGVKDIL